MRVSPFDLQAHRGGAGLVVENTMAAFRHALALGVSTLECDVHLSADDVLVVTHDAVVSPAKIRDTAPANPGDPAFPYVGRPVSTLTWSQLETLDAGSLAQPQWPGQRTVPGERLARFEQVLALAAPAPGVRVNVEVKHDAEHPDTGRPLRPWVDAVLGAAEAMGMAERMSVQSFDWEALRLVGAAAPQVRRYALTNTRYLQVGQAGRSPWLGGLDIDDVGGDVVRAVARLGFDALSPAWHPFVTPGLVAEAHAAGVLVVPYTVDEPATMDAMLDCGVDGFITNHPDRARALVVERGLPLPAAFPG